MIRVDGKISHSIPQELEFQIGRSVKENRADEDFRKRARFAVEAIVR
jgi:hypothetical protein